ncbi:MAG: hypothetical protein FWD31_02165, partial [Planctomycetaceae bacterium]|nr:hypothetical protein [Planctomycetaceae bacterium]
MKIVANMKFSYTCPTGRVLAIALLCGLFACISTQRLFAQETAVSQERQWQLSGTGQLDPSGVLQVTGDGKTTSAWRSDPIALQPGAFYRFSVSHRGVDTSGGCLPCGIEGFTRDYSTTSNHWTDESFYFQLPPGVSSAPLKVGQWESNGTFEFRDVKLEQVVPIIKEFNVGGLMLGEGETVSNGKYKFRSSFFDKGTNTQFQFVASNATFNSNRWVFGGGSQVEYRFGAIPPFNSGKFEINICYHFRGEGVVEFRYGSQDWVEIARIDKVGTREITLPESLSPVNWIDLRIRGLDGCNFQVDRIDFEVPILQETFAETLNLRGETLFAVVNQGEAPTTVGGVLTQNNEIRIFDSPNNEKLIPLNSSRSPGEREETFEYDGITYSLTTQTHPFERSDYGYVLPANRMASTGTFWWCETGWKVSRDRLPPEASPETARPIAISAAKNDVEGFQFVIRAGTDAPIEGLTGNVGELKGPNGAIIPAENVELLYAYYHFVHSKTDGTGLVGDWPDALPPLASSIDMGPIDIAAGKNQPIWINVKVPADAVAGDYTGTFELASKDGRFRVAMPYKLHVWNFALPTENHIETAYGYNPNQAAQYHNARSDADRRRVNEMYLQCFSDHRISIYNPTPFDGMSVKWLPKNDPPGCEIDFTQYDAEMERVLKKFHFTNFTVPGYGLGHGTFHSREEPSLEGFAEDTPEYKAMMTDYYTKLQAHLIEKGWIDKAYIYWFDEPGHHDYEFVANGTAKIQKYAPKIQRFMTLMMDNDGFMKALDAQNTSINIWCSISNS